MKGGIAFSPFGVELPIVDGGLAGVSSSYGPIGLFKLTWLRVEHSVDVGSIA